MGVKGDKMTKGSQISMERLAGKLASIAEVTVKKMLEGQGVFHDGNMFKIVDSKRKYFLKAEEMLKDKRTAAGETQQFKMRYYSLPEAVFGNQKEVLIMLQAALTDSK
jgi:DNA transformation protein and related proteins